MSPLGAPHNNSALNSAVYEGVVRHRRHSPRPHAFQYKVAQLFLDLDEIDRAFAGRWLWSNDRRNLAEFRRSDYFGAANEPLTDSVRDAVEQHTGRRPQGPIRLLTHLRYAGYSFNPVSFYYCYGADSTSLECILAEITNTPWRERHAYVLPIQSARQAGRVWRWQFSKEFHVSPFMAMDREYQWTFTEPGEHLRVHMNVMGTPAADKTARGNATADRTNVGANYIGKAAADRTNRGATFLDAATPEFDATLVLKRRPLDASALRRVLYRYPLMTAQVIGAIHWQALRLWLKGTPVHNHPLSERAPT